MKHQKRKKRDAYARRYGELVADKLRKLEDKHESVVAELTKTKAAYEELLKGYVNVCDSNLAQGRETDILRKELHKFQNKYMTMDHVYNKLCDLLEEKGFTLDKNTECPHDMVEIGEPFCEEPLELVKVDSCECLACEHFCVRLKDRGKIVCKEGQGGKPTGHTEKNRIG